MGKFRVAKGQAMLSNKTAGIVVLVLGVGLLVVSLSADVTGIGDDPGFGPQQTMGSVAGAIITVVGLYLTFKGSQARRPSDE